MKGLVAGFLHGTKYVRGTRRSQTALLHDTSSVVDASKTQAARALASLTSA
jgi:hypothetical protein